ncbi:hypothetical protein PVAP13_7NG273872 [Panicum virgatum]|uniref:Uncharacterized protein n=1 Tax=Panicum virgatum TaxID=38727 RepID=A0A8T0Q138_PANVG|nr:hypothetical protein PVAP13_7NG273872 [Panicum virgatum]
MGRGSRGVIWKGRPEERVRRALNMRERLEVYVHVNKHRGRGRGRGRREARHATRQPY